MSTVFDHRGHSKASRSYESSDSLEIVDTIRAQSCWIDHRGTEHAVPESLETMCGVRDRLGKFQGLSVEGPRPAQHCRFQNSELGPSPEVEKLRRFFEKKFLEKSSRREFPPLRILAPRHKETPPQRVIRLLQKTIPEKGIRKLPTAYQSLQPDMKIGRMIKRMSLTKKGHIREGIIPIREMPQVGMRLPADVVQACHANPFARTLAYLPTSSQGHPLTVNLTDPQPLGEWRGVPFVEDGETYGRRNFFEPAQILLIACDDKFQGGSERRHRKGIKNLCPFPPVSWKRRVLTKAPRQIPDQDNHAPSREQNL